MIVPDYKDFESLSKHGNLIPLSMEISGDLETPLSAFMKIDDGGAAFLLESVEGGKNWARYSFIGSDPIATIKINNNKALVSQQGSTRNYDDVRDIASFMKLIMAQFRPAFPKNCPEFFGGAIGFVGYDAVRGFEDLPYNAKKDPGFNDAAFMISRDVLIFDNLLHTIILTTNVVLDEHQSITDAYETGCHRLDFLKNKLQNSGPEMNGRPAEVSEFTSNMTKPEFESMVGEAKELIASGEIIQVVLSQRFKAPYTYDPLNIYRGLRTINPSPYMFYVKIDDEILAGSSPEAMVRFRNGEAVVRPIAGTRPRGLTEAEDKKLEDELLSDAKELAEHVMLVDLARNDLGRIAQPGTVNVDAFKIIEKYSHVMHMVSNVKARPAADMDSFDLLRAVFPAGTLSGAPKIRAMEIIEALESERRGPYGGCVGYFGFDGSMDMAITIRTVMLKDKLAYFQSGAGIVADSIPELEYEETMKKAEAMKRAAAIAMEFPGRKL